MLYSEKMPIFTAKHPAQTVTVDGAAYRYVRSGAGRDKTLVLLNGGHEHAGNVDGLRRAALQKVRCAVV